MMNRKNDVKTNGIDHFFSRDGSPGTMNAHSWYSRTGSAIATAMNRTIFSLTSIGSTGPVTTRSQPLVEAFCGFCTTKSQYGLRSSSLNGPYRNQAAIPEIATAHTQMMMRRRSSCRCPPPVTPPAPCSGALREGICFMPVLGGQSALDGASSGEGVSSVAGVPFVTEPLVRVARWTAGAVAVVGGRRGEAVGA